MHRVGQFVSHLTARVTPDDAAADLKNVTASRPEDVPGSVRFAAIYSNPPVRVGKAPLHELLETWLARSSP